ncbi:MAG: asparagine synthase (glutamine-hydrolyzing) [Planctomycetota bacterium]
MCGFAGLLRWDGLTDDDVCTVARASNVIAHRGPDSAGYWNDERIALGFRRLKIIDLSPAGEQPMANEDGSLRVVFNGEIYNHRELREELLSRGHVFKSKSDTEVLLHLFEELGEKMLDRLRGMFAFAIWNAPQRELFLARDPVGVKPLYFAERGECIAFASEAKALFALGVERDVDYVALDQALTYRYVPAPRSGFQNVEKLPPGHFARAKDGALDYQRWWSFSPNAIVEKTSGDETLGRLEVAVKRRLISDVPLGFWLSGGIDSALVLSQAGGTHPSFCAGFEQKEYDERDLARSSAAHLNSPLECFDVPARIFERLAETVWHADEPFFDSSMLPVYALAERTKPHASVVLSGDGGDEAFAGYDRYVGLQLLERYTKTPRLFRLAALKYAQWRYPAASRSGWDRMLRWLEKCRAMEASNHHPYVAAMELFTVEQRADLYGDAMLDATDGCDARDDLEGALLRAREAMSSTRNSAPGVLQHADLHTYLPGDVLHKVDRMSMAHGVEVRSPFLDVDLLNWALSLPDSVRLPAKQTKPLLRTAARQTLPPDVASARKRGFGVPLDDWFRGPLQKDALDVFEYSRCVADNIFKKRYWETLWKEHQAGQAQHGERLFALLATETWHRVFFGANAPTERPR